MDWDTLYFGSWNESLISWHCYIDYVTCFSHRVQEVPKAECRFDKQRMPCTSASIATDMTSNTRRHRNQHFNQRGHSMKDLTIMVIEKFQNNNIQFQRRRERFWIDELGCMAPEGMNLIWCACTSQNCTVAYVPCLHFMHLKCCTFFLRL